MAKSIDMYQMRKKLKTEIPEANMQVWQDAKHANLRLPNYTELKLEKDGPLTVSAIPLIGTHAGQPVENSHFTSEVKRACGFNLDKITYDQLVIVVTVMLSLREVPAKEFKKEIENV
jgi:hypothetical protein